METKPTPVSFIAVVVYLAGVVLCCLSLLMGRKQRVLPYAS